MKRFVFLIRPGAPLSEADRQRRAGEVLAWARRQNDEGRELEPRALDERIQRIGADDRRRGEVADERALANLLFLKARDSEEAVSIAETHPGLRYGASVEVRAWSSPAATPQRRRREVPGLIDAGDER